MDTQINIQADSLNSSDILSLHSHIINKQTFDTVNAKELHTFLDVGRHFAAWIKARVQQYQFVENEDFILITPNGVIKNQGGDRRSLNYFITLDMAKELAMVERNEKGREARRYFIDCERQLKATANLPSAVQTSAINTSHTSDIDTQSQSDRQLSILNQAAMAKQRALEEQCAIKYALEEETKYKMLNDMILSMGFREDTLVLPVVDMIEMIKIVRTSQRRIDELIAYSGQSERVNNRIERIKMFTNRSLLD